jgi:Flp pilus assembly protein TadG
MTRWRDQSGANAVEFALILPILVVMIFGLIGAGQLWNQQMSVTQAVREGARYGATYPDSASWEADVTARTVTASTGVLNASHITANLDDDGVVTVSAGVPGRLDIIMLPAWELTVSAESVAKYEGD